MILKISTKGYYITFPNMKPFNTPAKIEFNDKNLNNIIMELRKLGITEYTITSEDESIGFENKKKEQNIKVDPDISLDKLSDRFDILEELMRQSLLQKSETTIINKYGASSDNKKINKKPAIEEMDDFIPSIDLSGMTIKGSVIKTVKRDGDLKEKSDLLSKIVKE